MILHERQNRHDLPARHGTQSFTSGRLTSTQHFYTILDFISRRVHSCTRFNTAQTPETTTIARTTLIFCQNVKFTTYLTTDLNKSCPSRTHIAPHQPIPDQSPITNQSPQSARTFPRHTPTPGRILIRLWPPPMYCVSALMSESDLLTTGTPSAGLPTPVRRAVAAGRCGPGGGGLGRAKVV